jgi:hypothetical protein
MSDTSTIALMQAGRVRVSRKTPGGGMSDTSTIALMQADRVRVSRKTLEVA